MALTALKAIAFQGFFELISWLCRGVVRFESSFLARGPQRFGEMD